MFAMCVVFGVQAFARRLLSHYFFFFWLWLKTSEIPSIHLLNGIFSILFHTFLPPPLQSGCLRGFSLQVSVEFSSILLSFRHSVEFSTLVDRPMSKIQRFWRKFNAPWLARFARMPYLETERGDRGYVTRLRYVLWQSVIPGRSSKTG